MAVPKNILIVKANGEREAFDGLKLFSSLKKAGAADDVGNSILSHIEKEVRSGMSTHDIYKHAFSLLHKMQKPLAMKYSLRRSLMDLGPSGFPFEKFIAEVYKKKGYTALTDQIVKGYCTEHEVDVVAYNDARLIMIEAKFHNQLGIKSDLKVVLYVKARYDDLKQSTFVYGNKERKLDETLLITNTKFTYTAIKYAECQKMKIIGWNYPVKGNLVDMIEESGLHPLTSLTTLSVQNKRELMQKGIVSCSKIRDNYNALRELGLSEIEIKSVIDESNLICPVV